MKYEEWAQNWLNYQVRPTTKQRTYERYESMVRLHITPSIGGYDVDELGAFVLQKFTVSLTEKGMASSTVNGVISVLKSSLRAAVAFGIADVQHSDKIIRPKVIEKQVTCFSKEEQYRIERHIFTKGKQKHFGIVLCLYTGLRIGELLALTWSDVDLNKGLLSVSKSCHDSWQNGEYVKVTDTPKTRSSVRIIPLPRQLLPYLKKLKGASHGEYVVSKGTLYGEQVRTYQKMFEHMLKKLRIEHKGFHALRHTFATRALECGMDIKSLSEILGHKNPNITLNRYVHSFLEHKREMMNRLGKALL